MSALSTSQTPSRCPCSHWGTLETPPGCGSASSVGEDAGLRNAPSLRKQRHSREREMGCPSGHGRPRLALPWLALP